MNEGKSFQRFLLFLILFFGGLAWVAWAFRPQHTIDQKALDVWMLNVGQGESVLIREPGGKKLLFDGGPGDAVLSEIGALLHPADRIIDLIIVSHNHSDHIRGLISVLERYQVKEIWLSGAIHTTNEYRLLLETLQKKSLRPKIVFFDPASCLPPATQCPPSTSFGEAKIQVYHPLEDRTGQRPDDQHDATVMAKVSFSGKSLFLTGDVDEGHEAALLEACPPLVCSLQATLLQIPHHGSGSGLSSEFLAAVQPKAALIPVGQDNPYRHPHPDILEKLQSASIPIYRTDLQGRIHIVLTSNQATIRPAHP